MQTARRRTWSGKRSQVGGTMYSSSARCCRSTRHGRVPSRPVKEAWRIDLYLLHWRGRYPLEETVAAFEHLKHAGKIASWGVSNFDMDDMKELASIASGMEVATNQILYNLTRRGPEFDLMPWCVERKIPLMAYSPIEQGRLLDDPVLAEIAGETGGTPASVALAWTMRSGNVIAIPKSSNPHHVRDNRKAAELRLSDDHLKRLDQTFSPPSRKTALEML